MAILQHRTGEGYRLRGVRNQLNLGAFDLETAPATFPLADWHTGFHRVNRPALGGNGPRPVASLPGGLGPGLPRTRAPLQAYSLAAGAILFRTIYCRRLFSPTLPSSQRRLPLAHALLRFRQPIAIAR